MDEGVEEDRAEGEEPEEEVEEEDNIGIQLQQSKHQKCSKPSSLRYAGNQLWDQIKFSDRHLQPQSLRLKELIRLKYPLTATVETIPEVRIPTVTQSHNLAAA